VHRVDAAEPRPTLVVTEDASGSSPVRLESPVRLPLTWKTDDAASVAQASTPDGALEVTLTKTQPEGDAGQLLTVEARWLKKAWVRQISVELVLDGDHATVVGRDLSPAVPAPTGKVTWLERFDPKWITIKHGPIAIGSLLVDDTVDAVALRPTAKGVEVRLDLDSADARPFLHDARCTTNWRAPNQHLGTPTRLRVPDEKVTARVHLYPAGATPLVKARFPDGRRAALSWTDHADQTSARTLEALVHAFLAHHLAITKALFWHGTDRPQLEDPKVVKLADELAQAGSEVVPHSATPKPDPRNVTSQALDRFERWHTRTWIDHQPETNCEAFGDQGFHVGGKFGIADLLAAHGYQYVWAEDDAPPDDLNLLQPRHLDRRAPTVWPLGRLDLGGPDSLWMFRTVWSFLEATRFYRLYGPDRLDRLEKERGLHVAHTYLETYHPRRTTFGLRNLLVPAEPKGTPGGPGAVKLDPRFDSLLAALEERQTRGTLWVPTLGELGDRLRSVAEVTIDLAVDGSAVVHAQKALAGATFVVAHPDVTVEIGGHPPKGSRIEEGQTTFWDDLPAGDTTITLTRNGAAVAFSGNATTEHAVRVEARKVEEREVKEKR
jgi:hypothetical protein